MHNIMFFLQFSGHFSDGSMVTSVERMRKSCWVRKQKMEAFSYVKAQADRATSSCQCEWTRRT